MVHDVSSQCIVCALYTDYYNRSESNYVHRLIIIYQEQVFWNVHSVMYTKYSYCKKLVVHMQYSLLFVVNVTTW